MKHLSCSEYRLLVDEIGDADRLPIAAFRHVDGCADCARFGRELLALRGLLRSPARIAPPEDFDSALARRIRVHASEKPARRDAWNLGVPAMGLAVALAVAVGGVLLSGFTALEGAPAPEVIASNPSPGAVPAPIVAPGTDVPGKNVEAGPDLGTGESAKPSVPGQMIRTASVKRAPAATRRTASPERDALVYVRDTAGLRVVSIPRVIVGAEQIVISAGRTPAKALAPGDADRISL